MGIKMSRQCQQCNRCVEELYEVGWTHAGQFVVAGRCCNDCAAILKEKVDLMAKHIQAAKLN